MRFLRKDKVDKTILVISDIHLGAGAIVNSRRNYLEDFHYDSELVDFLSYYSSGDYAGREVKLIINGDLFDLLAVPFVKFYDDEFWSEDSSLEKLRMILDAHPEVIKGLDDFLLQKKKKIVFIIGNHDAEFVFDSLQKMLLERLSPESREKFEFRFEQDEYVPIKGVVLKHGHEYELAHQFDPKECIIEDDDGKRYFLPPWGSYYVTRIINKFKEERHWINGVRPIKNMLIHGFIFDTLYMLRFGLANAYYFLMVRFITFFKQTKSVSDLFKMARKELELWKDYEELTMDEINEREDVLALIVGHTHEPTFRTYANGKMFINTGTWTKMYNMEFGKGGDEARLTYAVIDVRYSNKEEPELDIGLNQWEGKNKLPFREFS